MSELPGQTGLSTQVRPVSNAHAGQEGLVVHLGSNVVIRMLDQKGRSVQRGLQLTLHYPGPDGPMTESIAYESARPVYRSLPAGTLVEVAVMGLGYQATSSTYQVPTSGQATFTVVVARRQFNQIISWHPVRDV